MKKKNFICIFPQGKNIHLIKDVGMIPYFLYKGDYYSSTIAFYEEKSKLPYLESEVNGIKYSKMKKYTKYEGVNILLFLIINYRKYDIVMLLHEGNMKFIAAFIIKFLSFNRVKFYFKLDMNSLIINHKFNKKSLIFKLKKKLIKYVGLTTVESKKLNYYLNNESYLSTNYLPNGSIVKSDISFNKENLIITVGRLGAKEKDIKVFLKALERIDLNNWKVKLIGPISENIINEIEKIYFNNPSLKEKIIFTGNISDRVKLEEEYSKAKVFVLTSNSEGFPLVLPEAIANGCYVVMTDLAPAYDITNNQEFGSVFKIGDSKKLSCILQDIIDEKITLPNSENIRNFARYNFDWNVISKKLYEYLENKEY